MATERLAYTMRLSLRKLLVLSLPVLLCLFCDQELASVPDEPSVDYILLVTDSATALALDSVHVTVTAVAGDTSSYITNAQGRVQVPTLTGSSALFEFSRHGYRSRDTVDVVNAPIDTVFHRPILRLIRIGMAKSN